MMISAKGSIRKAPNIVTIAKMSLSLKDYGDRDFTSFVKLWNERAPKQHKVVGNKATGLKLLLEVMPNDVLQLVLDHVGSHGWFTCVFSDDSLSTKKMYPIGPIPCEREVVAITHKSL